MDRRDNDIRDRDNRHNNQHLFRLGELDDYRVAKEDPDVRGWKIVDRDNRELGRVEELIVDVDREKVRYLDVVPTGDSRREGDHHLLLPIGVAQLDEHDNKVVMSGIERNLLDSYPPYRGEAISRDYEYAVIERFNGLERRDTERTEIKDSARTENDFYDNRLYDEDRFYTNRTKNRKL